MPAVTMTAHKKGDYLVDYEEKVFEDVKAAPGEKALVTFHTVAFEGSIGLVNILQALRLQRKGFKTTVERRCIAFLLIRSPCRRVGARCSAPRCRSTWQP
jgi:hypothetical protein